MLWNVNVVSQNRQKGGKLQQSENVETKLPMTLGQVTAISLTYLDYIHVFLFKCFQTLAVCTYISHT